VIVIDILVVIWLVVIWAVDVIFWLRFRKILVIIFKVIIMYIYDICN